LYVSSLEKLVKVFLKPVVAHMPASWLIVIYLSFLFPSICCLIVGIFQLNMLGIINSMLKRYFLSFQTSTLIAKSYGTEKIQ